MSHNFTTSFGKTFAGGTISTREDKLDFDKLYTYYDRSKKSVSDFVAEYQQVSNYNYYKTAANTLDYRYRLMDLYDYSMLDLHLTSIVDSLYHQIIGERYFFANEDGTINKEATKLIKKRWFSQYIRGVLESKLYGYTLMELGEVDSETGTLEEVNQVERRNVCPKDGIVVEHFHDAYGWDINSESFRTDYVLVDGEEGFGWLLKAIPVVMSKRFALSSHTQYAETYGTPLIVGKTMDEDDNSKQKLADEIAQARDMRVLVTGLEDEVRFESQISNDTNKIYTELVRLTNDELTMLILGQSATTESQAYAGSAEIQYRVMVDRVQAIREFVENNINEDLLWRLREKGMNIPEGVVFQYSHIMEMTPEQKKDLFRVLLQSYEIAPEEIFTNFGVKVGRQILEEANDQLLTNPDEAESKDPKGTTQGKQDEADRREASPS